MADSPTNENTGGVMYKFMTSIPMASTLASAMESIMASRMAGTVASVMAITMTGVMALLDSSRLQILDGCHCWYLFVSNIGMELNLL